MLSPVPPTDCTRAREAASARLDGELSELEAAHLDAHLRGCTECEAYAVEIAAAAAALRSTPLEQPEMPLFVARRRRPLIRVHVAAAALAVAAVTGSSFAVGQMLGSRGSRPTATVGTTVARSANAQPELVGMLRRHRPGRMMPLSRIIPV